MKWERGRPEHARSLAIAGILMVGLVIFGLAVTVAGLIGGGGLLFSAGAGCPGAGGGAAADAAQPPPSTAGRDSIPADYLALFQEMGHRYGVPWVLLAGIGKVESDFGRTTLPGVHSGSNAFGAAGPMQIGIGGASGNTWGGAPVHPAGQHVSGVATDGNGDGVASVYEPADAIAGAARYLLQHGVLSDASGAIFAYNHLTSYVQSVLSWAGTFARGGFTVAAPGGSQTQCMGTTVSNQAPNQAVATAISFARAQVGKPYLWGGTGPDAFDCSGLMMMAYRAAGISIPRTSEQQWAWGPQVPPGRGQPGDLVFFAGSDGTATSPGHVGLVIGPHTMIEAYATGFPIRVSQFGTAGSAPGDQVVVGFTRPWQHSGVALTTLAAR